VVTVLGFLLGRDFGFQQHLLGSALAELSSWAIRCRTTSTGCAQGDRPGDGVGGLRVGARGRTQVAQHAMAQIWNIPGKQRPSFWAGQVRGLLLLVVFAVGLAASSLPTWFGSYGEKAVVVALANLAAATAVNVGLFLVALRVLTPQQIPTRQLVAGALVAESLGRSCRPSVATWSATICAIPASCTGCSRSSLACCSGYIWAPSLALYAAEVNVVATRRLWPRSLVQPLLTNADQRARVTRQVVQAIMWLQSGS
jgi:hypothetical protein